MRRYLISDHVSMMKNVLLVGLMMVVMVIIDDDFKGDMKSLIIEARDIHPPSKALIQRSLSSSYLQNIANNEDDHGGVRGSISYSSKFSNCWNVPTYMQNIVDFSQETGREVYIPNDFGCSNVTLWTTFGVPSYFKDLDISGYYSFLMFLNDGESYDLCSRVGYWETKLGLSCNQLLCENNQVDNLRNDVEEVTEKQTSIFDWINYCQYCLKNNNTLRSHRSEFTPSNGGCFPKDNTVNEMINRFPSSITFCGNYEFGIPFIVNNTNVAHSYLKEGYSYLCYCPFDQYFSLKCANNYVNYLVVWVISITLSIIHGVSFVVTFFVTFLPKVTTSFKEKRPFNSITITCVVLCEILLFVAMVFSQWFGTSLAMTILSDVALSLVLLSLFTWVINWFRLILYVKTKKTIPFIIMYLVMAVLFLIAGVAIPILISVIYFNEMPSVNVFFSIYMSVLTFTACVAFVASAIWIYWTMKKVSDINMWNSSVSVSLFL
ncbi:hypothetical protein FDP41_003042 [Naegleria fowleri]|uniref:Uncharacterized protein n=1 Tax=Naegleria fowleri TaxID=5763 RepID=A0A6A5BVF1_NAEFO|nr:uncharacterized protein FDP41_003042 [Naegleria fowleri]KAF0977720.1 hypothetical protein FDP41_003042 [Naegleria fowleri]